MEGTEMNGSVFRIKQCGFDLMQLEEDLINDDEETFDEASWDVMGNSLRLKSTFLFFDFNHVIETIHDEELKQTLTVLANQLLLLMEELSCAVKSRSKPSMQRSCSDTIDILEEVIALLFPPQ